MKFKTRKSSELEKTLLDEEKRWLPATTLFSHNVFNLLFKPPNKRLFIKGVNTRHFVPQNSSGRRIMKALDKTPECRCLTVTLYGLLSSLGESGSLASIDEQAGDNVSLRDLRLIRRCFSRTFSVRRFL